MSKLSGVGNLLRDADALFILESFIVISAISTAIYTVAAPRIYCHIQYLDRDLLLDHTTLPDAIVAQETRESGGRAARRSTLN